MKSPKDALQVMRIQRTQQKQKVPWLLGCMVIWLLTACALPSPSQNVQQPTPTPTFTSTPTPTKMPTPTPSPTTTPTAPGWSTQEVNILAQLGYPAKAILVSIQQQVLHVYHHDELIKWSYVTTGRPELPSPKGFWKVIERKHPTTFYSPWPPGSPYWYPPTYINYALEYHEGGYFLHDATWRHYYGPGTNIWHQNPDGTWETGTHGCINMPLAFMAWLYDWTPLGTPVVVF